MAVEFLKIGVMKMKNKIKIILGYVCAFIGMMFSIIGGCMLDSEKLFLPIIICFVGIVFFGISIIINRKDWLYEI